MSLEISQRVLQVIARVQKMPVSDVCMTSSFEEMGMDSFDAINLLFALEEEFNIELPDVAKEYKRIDEAIFGIERLMLAKALVTEE